MNWIAGSIRNKILAVFALGIAMVVAGALYGFAAARSGLATVAQVNDTLIAQSVEAQAIEGTFKEQVQQWMSVLVRGHDAAAMDKSWKQFQFREREVRRAAEKLKEVVQVPAARDLLDKFLAAHKDMGAKYRDALEAFRASGFDAKKTDAQVKGIESGPGEMLEELVKLMRDESQARVAAARADANRGLLLSLAVIAAATLAALIACGLLIMRTVVRPLKHAVNVVDRVAAGDLTVDVKSHSRDETGRLLHGLQKMRDGLAEAVHVIRRSADGVGVASRQIAEGHADLSTRTDEQAASLEETASSMEQLAATVKQNSDSARQAKALATQTSQTAAKGGGEMERVIGTMGGISEASRKIGDILGLIDSIAFQTNILALNAAVEAARAGEQGRGFAVVAAEVRALAHRSAEAAKEIKALIQNSVGRVDEGTRLVEAAGATMQEIVDSVQRVTQMMGEISDASQEQLSGIQQVSDAVAQMDRVVQQNAALVAESAASAQSMADQAVDLVDSVAHFKIEAAPEAVLERPALPRSDTPRLVRPELALMAMLLPALLCSFLAASPALASDAATLADQQCATCHGKNGISTESSIPIIGGYSAKYIVESMKSFKKKLRTCAEVSIVSGPKKGQKSDMCKVVADLSDADFEALGKHYAGQKFVRAKQPFDPAKAARAAPVYKLRCEKCHEDNGASPDEDNGILAGQWTPYLRDQLMGFRSGKRPMDDKMKQRLDKVTREEEELLLHFFASQQ